MRTVTLDILNDEAIKLLRNLEGLNLIRVHKEEDCNEPMVDDLSLSEFSFSKSRAILKNYKGSLSDALVEERRNEI